MKFILSIVLSFSFIIALAQDAKKAERVLYVIDNVPVIDDPDKNSGILNNDDVNHLEVITDAEQIKKFGYSNIDKIINVTTKSYAARSEELKQIPTTKLMKKKGEVWFLKGDKLPYSGKFIDYYYNGKIQGEGILKAGIVDGLRTLYYQNGNKKHFRNYINGIANGYSEQYFINGKLQQKGSFTDGKDDGIWTDYYSTGEIKRQNNFVNLIPDITKDQKKFYDLQTKAIELMKEENYKSAIKKLNEAEKLNYKYADLYFYRGTAELDNFDFGTAVADFDKAINLEPLYMEALANRAFARIRKYEFKDSRTLSRNDEVTILASKSKLNIPLVEKVKICDDLNKCVELGDDKTMILDALKTYCEK